MNWQEVKTRSQSGNPQPEFKIHKTNDEWARILSPEAFHVTRQHGTETAFSGGYCTAHQPGLYACVGCGTLLFDSRRKYDSETGWPSFDEPVEPDAVAYHPEGNSVEVRCNTCDAHLGHVFPDGPAETTGLRFCINSAALLLLPERPFERFNLQYETMMQGELRPAPYTLLFVFRMDCPGCFLYGLEDAASIATAFDPGQLQVLGLCSAFGNFDADLKKQLSALLQNGQITQAMLDAIVSAGKTPEVAAPNFPVALDRITTPEEFLNGDTLQWFYSLNPRYPLLTAEDVRNIVAQATLYYRQLPMVAHTFSLNFLRGTPAFILLNESGDKLADWLGYIGSGALEHQIRLLTRL